MPDYFSNYLRLRDEVDKQCDYLGNLHSDKMVCREGCDSCCMNFGLLAVEFYSIAEALKGEKPEKGVGDEGGCPFLVDHRCTIYSHRPIICRSHGLPILQMGEEDWDLSACHLNFTDIEEDYFTENNCYRQDLFNSKLYLVNRTFLSQRTVLSYSEQDLISLSKLAEILE